MRLDPCRPVPRSGSARRRIAPRRLRLTGQIGRAEHEIETGRAERQQDQRRERGRPPPPAGASRRRRRRGGVGRREQPPRDFDPRGLGLALADQARRAVALDLVELVAIDRDVAAGRAAASRRASGHSTAKIAAAVISAMTNQSIMAEGYHPRHGQAKYNSRGTAPECAAQSPEMIVIVGRPPVQARGLPPCAHGRARRPRPPWRAARRIPGRTPWRRTAPRHRPATGGTGARRRSPRAAHRAACAVPVSRNCCNSLKVRCVTSLMASSLA